MGTGLILPTVSGALISIITLFPAASLCLTVCIPKAGPGETLRQNQELNLRVKAILRTYVEANPEWYTVNHKLRNSVCRKA